MSSSNPFDKGGRTVIKPNPGGAFGRPMPASDQAFDPGANADDWSDQGQHRDPGLGRQQNEPFETSPSSQAREDDWYRHGKDTDQLFPDPERRPKETGPTTQKIPLEIALRAARQDVDGPNSIMNAAGPLLILLGRLRLMVIDMEAIPLMEFVAGEIQSIDAKLKQSHVPAHDIELAKYVLSGTADDIVQNLPGTDRNVWLRYSMVARFFNERTSGTQFFEHLKTALENPAQRYDILELMYTCMSIGFEGKYRGSGGEAELGRIRRATYEALRRVKPRNEEEVSPRWRGLAIAATRFRNIVPLWVVAGVAGAFLLALFFLYQTLLGTDSHDLGDDLMALHPLDQISISRPVFKALDSKPLTRTAQLDRIRGALSDEIERGVMKVESVGDYIIIEVNNVFLFASGSANTKDNFAPVARRIAAALNTEPGPIRVIGHTDNVRLSGRGRFKSNFDLSVARAKSVANLLAAVLNSEDRLAVEGKGELSPIVSNKTKQGRAQNRRVEVMIQREETL